MHFYKTFLPIFVLTFFTIGVSTDAPNWTGLFQLDNSCNQNECCCVDNQVKISSANNTHYLISANIAGVPCVEQLNRTNVVNIYLSKPTDQSGYQITTSFLGSNNRFTLSSDSEYIAHVNLDSPRCSGMARRVTSQWEGKYIVDKSCDESQCCCLADEVTISKANEREYLVSGSVSGQPCKQQLNGSTTIEARIPIPQDMYGYQLTTNFLGTNNRFTMTFDNEYVANVNLQYPRCSGMARRKSTTPTNAATEFPIPIASMIILLMTLLFL